MLPLVLPLVELIAVLDSVSGVCLDLQPVPFGHLGTPPDCLGPGMSEPDANGGFY